MGYKKLALFYDPIFLTHDTGSHPESSARLEAIMSYLDSADINRYIERLPSLKSATIEHISLAHTLSYIEHVKTKVESGSFQLDLDTAICRNSYNVALEAVSANIVAVDTLLDPANNLTRAFCPVRPPGHHALPNSSMGFCIFNNIAISAKYALTLNGINKVAIIDFDLHHGNGTEAIVQNNDSILFISSHQSPLYPGTGLEEENHLKPPNIINYNLHAGDDDLPFCQLYERKILPKLLEFKPDILFFSAGFDGHKNDPLGGLNLTEDGFFQVTKIIVDALESIGTKYIISSLEGGYDLDALPTSVEAHLAALIGVDNVIV